MFNYYNEAVVDTPNSALQQLELTKNQLLQQLEYQFAINHMLVSTFEPNDLLQINHQVIPPPSNIEKEPEIEDSMNDSNNMDSESEIYYSQNESVSEKKRVFNRISHNSSSRNDTKNIPKNYGKAILTFIQKSPKTKNFINESNMGITFSEFMMQVRRIKKKVNSMESLRKMWGSENLENKIRKCIRILSYKFMRKHCLQYIFHSKVKNYGVHIKYRQKLIEGIENPVAFNHIKDF